MNCTKMDITASAHIMRKPRAVGFGILTIVAIVVLMAPLPHPVLAEVNLGECMASYYRTKASACLDGILAASKTAGSTSEHLPTRLVGFFAQLLKNSPTESKRILAAESSPYAKMVVLVSLHRAGRLKEAQKYAAENNLSAVVEKLDAERLVPLDAVRPSSAEDIELMVGAYMASGDPTFIQRLLDDLSSVDDTMARDAFRMGLLTGRYGPSILPEGRPRVTIPAACERYQCRQGTTKLFRMTTLSGTIWALLAMSGHDDGVKKTLGDFFTRNGRLKALFETERTALDNYAAALVVVEGLKNDHSGAEQERAYAAASRAVSIYETLGPASEAFAPSVEPTKN